MSAISAKQWTSIVERHSGFLSREFGFALTAVDDTSNWETSVTYSSSSCAVLVRYSVEFERAEVELVRLVDGKVPAVPIFVHPETPIDRGLLDNLLAVRAPQKAAELRRQGGLDDESIETTLQLDANALREFASDILSGNLKGFDEIEKFIHDRVAKHPQKITLHLPEGTPQPEVDRAVAQARTLDPRVPVDVHYYRKPS